MSEFSKLLWIELIGFDHSQSDYGVSALLDRMSVQPQRLSLLLWNTELIHRHAGLGTDAPIGSTHCAYCARPRNEEHERQEWTRFQLKGLIDTLHGHGIQVYVSFFDQVASRDWRVSQGLEDEEAWIEGHPELLYVLRNGRVAQGICPLKRLADGRYYEDFFFRQLEGFLNDYGFDGLHAADGYSLPRFAIHEGDFSEDMVDQFKRATGLEVPVGTPESRAQWILGKARLEWIDFLCQREASFWRKGLEMLRRNGKGHVFNTCWTRDPLEARYRFGIDYGLLSEAGVREWIAEAQAAVIETEGWNRSDVPMQDYYRAMMTRLRACLPSEAHVFLLHCVKDGLEQYNVLRHAPAFMDSDVYSLTEEFLGHRRLLDGVMVCLADGIRREEWHRLDRTYQRAFASLPQRIPAPSVVWSDEACTRELASYVEDHRCSSFRLHSLLLSQGAVLPAVVPLDGLSETEGGSGPLVLLHPCFYTASEREKVLRSSGGELAEIGLVADGGFVCRLYHHGRLSASFSCDLADSGSVGEASSWLEPLPEHLPPREFVRRASSELNRGFSLVESLDASSLIRLSGWFDEVGRLHLFVCSEKRTYHHATIRVGCVFRHAEAISDELVLPPELSHEGGCTLLRLKLPPSGTIPVVLSV